MWFDVKKLCTVSLHISSALATFNFLADIGEIASKALVGIQLTSSYALSYGKEIPPIDQDVTFWCTMPNPNGNRQTDLNQTFLDDSNIMSKINFKKPVNFVIHGWLSGLNGRNMYSQTGIGSTKKTWMRTIAMDWAQFGDCNVCAVDWSRLANYAYPIAAMHHSKIVADFVVQFMIFLMKNGMDFRQVSIAGHSLGAHVAGFIGNKFMGKIDTIYGIDPAGLGFTAPFDFGPQARLDPSDATYVQCIHTCRAVLGTLLDCGHADFIANGGIIQPGCYTIFCSHSRATEYFRESLQPINRFIAAKRNDLVTDNLLVECSMDQLGIHSARLPGRYFLETRSTAPYALVRNTVPNFNNKRTLC